MHLFEEEHDVIIRRPVPIALRLIIGLIFLILLGTGMLMLPIASADGPLPLMDALFTATSALTVTGLTVRTTSTDFTTFGHLILLALIQLGGVGYMFAISLVLLLIGRRLSFRDQLTLTSSLGLDNPGAILQILKRSFYGIILIEGIGAVLLYWHWQANDIVPGRRALLFAVFHAVSAFCNAGFDLFAGRPEYPGGIPNDNLTLIIMGSLIFLGGLGIPVLSELFVLRQRRWFSLHSRLTLTVVILLVLLGWFGLLVPETRPGGILHEAPLSNQLVRTLFQSISARTAGFPGMADFHALAPESQLVVMVLMFIGVAPASMGGGITTGTFAVLALTLWSYARGSPTVSFGRRAIAPDTVRRAGVVLTISLGLVTLSTWLILMTHRVPFNQALFEVISAFATCGLSLGITGDLNTFGRLVIIVMMFWGRLGALTIAMAIAQHGLARPPLVRYPEETILI